VFSITRRYNEAMPQNHPLPDLWLISDERNDDVLEQRLRALPRGSGFIYRHYHLDDPERWARFRELRRIAKACEHRVILADSALTAREWGADGIYGAPLSLCPKRSGLIQLATVHSIRELTQAQRKGADAALVSPVLPTRSHPGGGVLGPVRFRMLARQAHIPVIALGGMSAGNARALQWTRWAAIDGLS
jgi:thiamine-phosphate pyrophosphorylase